MRKMKKINGFYVVRFNDREKRNNPTLGSFGVIDAEQYTGDIDFDLDAFEFTDADLIEVAVEQARSLDAEMDFGDESVTYTIVTETAHAAAEEEVEPKLLALEWQQRLETQIKSPHYEDIDAQTAAHELHGYKVALRDLGLLEQDETVVEPDTFGPATGDAREELAAYVCDEVCHFREGRTQEELDAVCERCRVGEVIARLPRPCCTFPDDGFRAVARLGPKALVELSPHEYTETEIIRGCTVQTLKCRKCGYESFAWSKPEAPEPEARTGFAHLPEAIGYSLQTKRVYALGLALAERCPDNDCRVYLNIFNMARSLDDAIGEMSDPDSYPAIVLRRDLHERLRELGRMYHENFAVQQFKEGMKP